MKVKTLLAGLVLAVASMGASAVEIAPGAFDLDYTTNQNFYGEGTSDSTFVINVTEDKLTTTILKFSAVPDAPLTVTLTGAGGSETLIAVAELGGYDAVYKVMGLVQGTYSLVVSGATNQLVGNVSAVPVPAAALLFGSALLGFAGFSARRKVS